MQKKPRRRIRLSSYDTLIYQFVFPLGWLAAMGPLAYLSFLDIQAGEEQLLGDVGGIIFAVVVFLWMLWQTWPLKKVVLEGDAIRISGWLRRDRVSLLNISGVRRGHLFHNRRMHTLTVDFNSPTWFGRRIHFLLTGGDYGADQTQMVLMQALRKARRADGRR